MKKITKLKYVSPKIEELYIELEQGIASDSAALPPWTGGDDGFPIDWEKELDPVEDNITWG